MDEPEVEAGSDESVEAGTPIDLSASFVPPAAENAAGLLWSTSGSGTFNDETVLHPFYTPSPDEEGSTLLTLTVTGWEGCKSVSDEMTLEVTPLVTALDDENLANGLKHFWNRETRILSVWTDEKFPKDLSWKLYDLRGTSVYSGMADPGSGQVRLDGHGLSEGIYIFHLEGMEKRLKVWIQ